ncbi:glucan endo-1,3-beta-glucosidase 13-like isoform X2 [Cynara cardunculus var. scolymus]|uniref:glucan endo-1,3-beta-glucosidase 13-like isoform X2 n=1 Tax=Cynara cardunculus var. scolymus TaxID=59895 RepID=UPI000D62A282|nr:glucan endo-1,3-beta-glucosidase 13-like isoform X2 [Cynara cardunculus var. scolymus]
MAVSTIVTLLLLLLHLASSSATGIIGVNYGRIADNLPNPTKVVQLLKSNGINRIKLYDTDSTVLKAFAGSNIAVTVALPNNLLSAAASNQSFTDNWVQSNILPYHPETLIDAIAVGNEVFVDPNNTTDFLVPAMKNVYDSLQKNKIDINVSSPVALSALATSYPPSSGSFKPELVEPVMKPMLSFLKKTGSVLMVNAYPFFAYGANTDTISLDYALLRENKGVPDPKSGIVYKTLLEAQLDAVYAAMDALQFPDVKMVVSETGWPSKGDSNEPGAGEDNAAQYNGNLVRRVLTGGGTPLRPNDPLVVYLFALFNEDQKTGPTSERNYGLFYPNEQKVYNVPLSKETLANLPSAVSNGSKSQVAVAPSTVGQTWCVANGKVGEEKLQAALDYACGEGGADCRPIQSGDTCYDPNTLEAHASYAFNSYYQKQARGSGSCDFGGAAYVVSQPPRFGSCKFPTSN